MNLLQKVLILFILAMSVQSVCAQVDPKNPGILALQKSAEIYRSTKKFSLDVVYAVYFDRSDFTTPDESATGKIIRDNGNFFQEEMGSIKVLNKDFELVLNSDARVITIGDRKNTELVPEMISADSLASGLTTVETIENGYRYTVKSGSVEKIDFLLDPSGLLRSVRMHYRYKMDFGDGPKHVVTQFTYRNFKKNPKLTGDEFSLSEYVSISRQREVSLTKAYKNYYLINNIQTP